MESASELFFKEERTKLRPEDYIEATFDISHSHSVVSLSFYRENTGEKKRITLKKGNLSYTFDELSLEKFPDYYSHSSSKGILKVVEHVLRLIDMNCSDGIRFEEYRGVYEGSKEKYIYLFRLI